LAGDASHIVTRDAADFATNGIAISRSSRQDARTVSQGDPKMTALTVRLPNDKHARLKTLARRRGTSVNRLIEEMATLTLAEFDAETRFLARAARGRGRRAAAWPCSPRRRAVQRRRERLNTSQCARPT